MQNTASPHSYSLPAFAVHLLSSLVEIPGWAKGNRELFAAFEIIQLLDELPEIKAAPAGVKRARSQREALDLEGEWCRTPVAFSLTDKQRDSVRICLRSVRDSGQIGAGFATVALLKTFDVE